MRAARAHLVFAGACTAAAVWAAAYLVATRLVDPGGTSGTVLGDIVYPQLEALATVMLAVRGGVGAAP